MRYFVTNEGNSGNGSISFVSNDGVVENNVLQQQNSTRRCCTVNENDEMLLL